MTHLCICFVNKMFLMNRYADTHTKWLFFLFFYSFSQICRTDRKAFLYLQMNRSKKQRQKHQAGGGPMKKTHSTLHTQRFPPPSHYADIHISATIGRILPKFEPIDEQEAPLDQYLSHCCRSTSAGGRISWEGGGSCWPALLPGWDSRGVICALSNHPASQRVIVIEQGVQFLAKLARWLPRYGRWHRSSGG